MNFAMENYPIHIDGSQGEGGGQVLRTALSLSVITGKSVRITNIRANRSIPGLRPQHLKSLDAAAAISRAQVQGSRLGSDNISFIPGDIRTGRYNFDIGTAGAATLVLQTIFIPLSLANSSSSIRITGGTHVPWSPSFDYLEVNWLTHMHKLGFDSDIRLLNAGFYPKGAGRIDGTIRPAKQILPLSLVERGKLIRIMGISAVANLNTSIADRQKRQAIIRMQKLTKDNKSIEIRFKTIQLPSTSKGTYLLLLPEFENGRCCFFSLGELGKPAERVADEAVDKFFEFLKNDAPIDQYLADQILLPISLAQGSSEIKTSKVTRHLITNAEIIRKFLSLKIDILGELGEPGLIKVTP